MLMYNIDEFTAEVMEQLKGFVRPGDPVEFEIKVYNPAGTFIASDIGKKGLCVGCGMADVPQKYQTIKFTLFMK